MLEPSTVHDRSPRRALAVLAVLAVVMLLVVGAVGGWYVWASGGSGGQTKVSLEIPKGSTTADIASLLHAKGVIRSAFMFRLMARFHGLGGGIEAGRYELTTHMSVNDVFAVLRKGPIPIATVTFGVPEGLRVEAVAKRAAEKLGLSEQGFLKIARGGKLSIPPYLPDAATSLEGFLFPKTYEFFPHPTAQTVIQKMLDQFAVEAKALPWANAAGLGVTQYQAVTIASLVEREGKFVEDRGKIAQVIYNRLAIGMKLGLDVTVAYIDPDPSNGITVSDLAIDSPYNTRLHPGLPPTPIASPGLPSLLAALTPTPGHWLYFVSDQDGHAHFAETYAEFLQLVSEFNA